MGKFLTAPARTEQVGYHKYRLIDNELYKDDDGEIYLAWRNYITDNFTWLNSNGYDTRCAHIHDVGCEYKSVIKVKLNESQLRLWHFLITKDNKIICKNIPSQFLEVCPITGNQINNLFYRMLKSADAPPTPKFIQCAYRAGVALNLKWFLPIKRKIDLTKIYDKDWNNAQYKP